MDRIPLARRLDSFDAKSCGVISLKTYRALVRYKPVVTDFFPASRCEGRRDDSKGVVRTGWTLSRLIVDKTGADKDRPSNGIVSQAASIVAPVSRAPFERASKQTSFVSTHIVDTDALRVRYTPDKYASTTVILKFGDEVQFMDSVDNWSRIAYTSNSVVRTGWVLSKLIVEKSGVDQELPQN